MRYNFKEGVPDQRSLHPVMIMALFLVKKFYEYKNEELVITSTRRSDNAHSMHYHGLAIDIRIYNLRDHEPGVIAEDLRNYLGNIDNRFDVVLEGDHIHVEFDRRKK